VDAFRVGFDILKFGQIKPRNHLVNVLLPKKRLDINLENLAPR
jgi:hypothetical protein